MANTTAYRSVGLQALRTTLSDAPATMIARGIEKEGLRVLPNLDISQDDYPSGLGHPLTHPNITTDYSEALLELITPVIHSRSELMDELQQTHAFVFSNLDNETLWCGSMPCRLHGNESVRIAEYGDSNIGKLKHIYRKGLDVRYGRIMQSIAGLHFNFSLSDEFWEALRAAEKSPLSLQAFKSDKYFALTRNFRRFSWLLMYLFGASPALDQSFVENKQHTLDKFDEEGTLYRPYATSLRMSDLGYNNNAQSALNICFNTLDNFTKTLGEAVHKPYPPYEKMGTQQNGEYIQLNTNILQIENEYYSAIRPKRSTLSGEKPTAALIERGVEYVEIRCLDLNPYLPLGIDANEIAFMDCFLLHCLTAESPYLADDACSELSKNFARVTVEGRAPDLMLSREGSPVSLQAWANELLDDILNVAEILDAKEATSPNRTAVEIQRKKVLNSELCPSARILSDMREQDLSWLELAGSLSREHKSTLLGEAQSAENLARFEHVTAKSRQKANEIKLADSLSFDDFLAAYIKA